MKRLDFNRFRDALVQQARVALRDFAASKSNRDVYAVSFDAHEFYGGVTISVNTLADFERTRDKHYFDWMEEKIGGIGGVKYNPGDFGHIGVGPASPELDKWAEHYTNFLEALESDAAYFEALEHFSDAIVSAIQQLEPELALLHRTPDFIVFHGFHDVSDDVKEALMKKTVDSALIDRLFPELRQYREFVEGILARPPEEAARIWLSVMESYLLRREDPVADRFYKWRSNYDIQQQLIELGESAMADIFKLLDRVIFEPQFNVEGSEQRKVDGMWTRESSVSSHLIWAIEGMGVFNEVIERKLLGYVHSLHEMSQTEEDPIGSNINVAARALHALAPEKFPPAETESKTNRLLNIDAYISDAS